jgi:hypothetical protein
VVERGDGLHKPADFAGWGLVAQYADDSLILRGPTPTQEAAAVVEACLS